jgi:hypothetical protein
MFEHCKPTIHVNHAFQLHHPKRLAHGKFDEVLQSEQQFRNDA